MSPKWTFLLICLLVSPSVVAPQISLGTLRSILCVLSRGVFHLNGCVRKEKFLCRMVNLEFRFFCQSFACTRYNAPTERSCTNLLFQCPILKVLPYGICPPFQICCDSGGSIGNPSPPKSSPTGRKRTTSQVDLAERSSEFPSPRWRLLSNLNKAWPKPTLVNGKVWNLTLTNVGKNPSPEESPDKGRKVERNSLLGLGEKLASNTGKLLTNAASSVGKQIKLASDQMPVISGKLLSDTISSVGKKLTLNKFPAKAGKAVLDTVSNVGETLVSNKAVANASKLMLDAAATIGKKFKHLKFIKREKQRAPSQYGATYFNIMVKDLIDDKFGELSSPDDLPIAVESYIQDWPSDESDMNKVEMAIEQEFVRFMDKIDLVNDEEAHKGGVAIVKMTFEDFRAEILGD